MIKIKIYCSFCSSDKCKEVFERINYASELSFYGKDAQYFFTNDDDYTHAIIMNTAMPLLSIPKENVLGLAFEPPMFLNITPRFIEYAKIHIGRYFIGDKKTLPAPFMEHFAYMWHSRPCAEITIKPKLMSIIVSEKKRAPGHIYRHKLIEQIIKYKLPIDIYGRGSAQYNYEHVCGNFDGNEPYEKYAFSICIENVSCNEYFSEKIITPLMYNCVPIYWGCKNITHYLENVICLNGHIEHDMSVIMDIIENMGNYYKNTYTEKNIKAVNLIQNLPTLFPISVHDNNI